LNIRVGDLYCVVNTSLAAIVVTLASAILAPLILKSSNRDQLLSDTT
jgi:hypothetical protein